MDQPQPVSQVLSVPVHIAVVQILGTFQGRVLSCPQDPEFWVLSDTSIPWTCGEGEADAADAGDTLGAGTPKGTLPGTHLPAGDRRSHSTGGWCPWQGRRAGRGVFCVLRRGQRGSPGSHSEVSLSLPGPRANPSQGATPLPPEAEMKHEPPVNSSEQEEHVPLNGCLSYKFC